MQSSSSTSSTVDDPATIRRGLLLALIGVVAFSLTLPFTREAVAEFSVQTVTVWRALIAGIIAGIILLVMRPKRPHGKEWATLAGCAFGTVIGFPVFSTLGMQTVPAAQGAVVIALLPIATALAGVVLSGERPSGRFWLFSLLGTVITLAYVLFQSSGSIAWGHVHLLIATITAGIGYAYGAMLARRIGGWVVACWVIFSALPIVIALAFLTAPPDVRNASLAGLTALAYVAVFSQLAGFFAWYRGLALAGIARASQVQLLQLFFTVAFAVTLFGESFDWIVLPFGVAVLFCVWASTRARMTSK